MTKGRYYRAAEDAPCVPSATYLVSREWTINKLQLPHGEWGGAQFPDDGAPPRILPQNQPIGGDCLERLRPTPEGDGAGLGNFGRCVRLATRQLCGNSPLFANFSLAYDTGSITYYRDVPNYLTKDDGEGEWSARIVPPLQNAGTLPNAVTRIRVTEDMGGELDFRFAICDNLPPPPDPVHTDCCGPDVPGRWIVDFAYIASSSNVACVEIWRINFNALVVEYNPALFRWEAYATCAGTQVPTSTGADFLFKSRCAPFGPDYFWLWEVVGLTNNSAASWRLPLSFSVCTPFSVTVPTPRTTTGGANPATLCGNTVNEFTHFVFMTLAIVEGP